MSSPYPRSIGMRSQLPLVAVFRLALLLVASALSAVGPARAEKWALLIGIDAYKDKNHINNLGAAAADARALKAALVEAAGFPEKNVHLLVSDPDLEQGEISPEYNNILRELAMLTERVKPGDTVFVMYSGHGIETGGKTYLLPYDTDASDETNLTDTAIPTEKFRQRLMAVHAGTLVMAFDMCRTNPHRGAKGVSEPNNLTAKEVKGLGMDDKTDPGIARSASTPVIATLFACSPDQQSYEWIDKGRGYFSYFFEEGLRGRAADAAGTVRLGSLVDYVSDHVKETVHRDEGRDQEPFYETAGNASDLVLATGALPVAAPVIAKTVEAAAIDTIGRFRVVVSPTGAAISVDGVPINGKLAAIDLGVEKTRTIAIHVEAPGCAPEERSVTIQRGLNPPVVVLLNGDAQAIAAASAPKPIAVQAELEETVTSMLRGAADGGAVARFVREDGGDTLTAHISTVATQPIRVRAVYRAPSLQEGGRYEIQFRARADRARSIGVRCQAGDGDQHTIGVNGSVELSTEYQQFNVAFTATRISHGANYAPIFLLGGGIGTVQISSLKLVSVSN